MYPVDRGDTHYLKRYLAVSQGEVAKNFQKYGLLDDQVVFLEGWFKDTLPAAPIQELAWRGLTVTCMGRPWTH